MASSSSTKNPEKVISFLVTPLKELKEATSILSEFGKHNIDDARLSITKKGFEVSTRTVLFASRTDAIGRLFLDSSKFPNFHCSKPILNKRIFMEELAYILKSSQSDDDTLHIFHVENTNYLSFVFANKTRDEYKLSFLTILNEVEKFPNTTFFFEASLPSWILKQLTEKLEGHEKSELVVVEKTAESVTLYIDYIEDVGPWVDKSGSSTVQPTTRISESAGTTGTEGAEITRTTQSSVGTEQPEITRTTQCVGTEQILQADITRTTQSVGTEQILQAEVTKVTQTVGNEEVETRVTETGGSEEAKTKTTESAGSKEAVKEITESGDSEEAGNSSNESGGKEEADKGITAKSGGREGAVRTRTTQPVGNVEAEANNNESGGNQEAEVRNIHHAWFKLRHLSSPKRAATLGERFAICLCSEPEDHVMMRFNFQGFGELAFIYKAETILPEHVGTAVVLNMWLFSPLLDK